MHMHMHTHARMHAHTHIHALKFTLRVKSLSKISWMTNVLMVESSSTTADSVMIWYMYSSRLVVSNTVLDASLDIRESVSKSVSESKGFTDVHYLLLAVSSGSTNAISRSTTVINRLQRATNVISRSTTVINRFHRANNVINLTSVLNCCIAWSPCDNQF